MTMARRSVLLCTVCVAAIALAYAAASMDWYAYGDAVPPVIPATITNNGVQVLEWSAGLPGADGSVPAGEKFQLTGQLQIDVEHWWWNATRTRVGSNNAADRARYLKAQADKPVPLMRMELVSRSSLNAGEFVAASHPFRLRPDGKEAASFKVDAKAPLRPGVYELRLIFGSLRTTQIPFKREWDDERVIASRSFRVRATATSAP